MSTLLRVATAGSVDDGKSTLIGRLLHDAKALMADELGTAADLARLTDGLRAEREQGITIDVAYRHFATPSRRFVLHDCPGHAQYTRNMATGASTADLALVLVDARRGMTEQSRRHLAIAALLAVPNVTVLVNKMDLVGDDVVVLPSGTRSKVAAFEDGADTAAAPRSVALSLEDDLDVGRGDLLARP